MLVRGQVTFSASKPASGEDGKRWEQRSERKNENEVRAHGGDQVDEGEESHHYGEEGDCVVELGRHGAGLEGGSESLHVIHFRRDDGWVCEGGNGAGAWDEGDTVDEEEASVCSCGSVSILPRITMLLYGPKKIEGKVLPMMNSPMLLRIARRPPRKMYVPLAIRSATVRRVIGDYWYLHGRYTIDCCCASPAHELHDQGSQGQDETTETHWSRIAE